jgi:hypothetical protein
MDLLTAQQFNCAAFILQNKIVNENGNPIEFKFHKFLAAPYMDNTPRQVVRKAGQVGWSTLAIIRALHLAKYHRANIIYTLPSKSVVKDFVTPKVDPLIQSNPEIASWIGQTDSTALKAVGDRFVYFRGSWEQGTAISISAHILINDEVDRSNQKVLRTYQTRLDAAKMDRPDLGWVWQFSNPSRPGEGVDAGWDESDQKMWFIKCSRCNREQTLTFPENIDFKTEQYICKHCYRVLSPEDRANGRWYATRYSPISGYWISQLMVPWHSAAKIIEDSKGDQAVFHNFTLGLPYTVKDMSVSKGDLIRCLIPDPNPRVGNAMGVDQNATEKHYVIGNKYGIFRVGAVESWEEIEDLRNQYSAYCVIDANPYPTKPTQLAQKYRGKVFIHYYKQDTKNVGTIQWGEGDDFGVVYSDRTKIIDAVVADIMAQDLVFNMTQSELENYEYFYHWQQMYRIVEEVVGRDGGSTGIRKPVWKHPEGKPDHLAHATVYWKIAMEKTLSAGAVVTTGSAKKEELHPVVNPDSTVQGLNMREVMQRSLQKKRGDWRTR